MLQPAAPESLKLSIMRLIAAPRAALYRCWTDPASIVKWFTPPPFDTSSAELDVPPGVASLVVMRSPEGVEMPNRGQYLDVVPDRRPVFTDAYLGDRRPSGKPFMTVVLTFDDDAGGTRCAARARHWTAEERDAHSAMGFETGWGIATDQLAALAATL